MALRRARQARKASITSLIDVIFLLLLFFMLASTFTDHAELELVASQGAAGSEIDSLVQRLNVGAETLSLDGELIALEMLASTVSARADGPGAVLAVDPAVDADTERLVTVLMALKDLEGVALHVVEPAR